MTEQLKPVHWVISIDGPDGVGKSTIIKAVAQYFNQKENRRYAIYSPSYTTSGKEVKRLLKLLYDTTPEGGLALCRGSAKRLGITTLVDKVSSYLNLLHEHSLIEVTKQIKEVLPTLKLPHLILIDRWLPSYIVFQCHAPAMMKNEPPYPLPPELQTLDNDEIVNLRLVLTADDEVIGERMRLRDDPDFYDEQVFQHHVRQAFNELANVTNINVGSPVQEENIERVIKTIDAIMTPINN